MPSFIIYQEAMTLKRSHKEIMTSIFIGFNVRNLTYNDEVDLFLERSLGQFET